MLQTSKTALFAFLLISTLSLTACAPKGGSATAASGATSKELNAAAVVADPSLTTQKKSEILASMAERLLTPNSYFFASEVATESLKADPKNPKARLISAMLAPQMVMKGIAKRLQPFADQNAIGAEAFGKFSQQVQSSIGSSPAANFLYDGPADIQTESDIQDLIALYTSKLNNLRLTLEDLEKGDEIELSIDTSVQGAKSLQDIANNCQVTKVANLNFALSDCTPSNVNVRLNRADLQSMAEVVAGQQIFLTFLTAWDVNGAYVQLGGDTAQGAKYLISQTNFGKARSSQTMGVVPNLLRDMVVGSRYALGMQKSYCAKTTDSEMCGDARKTASRQAHIVRAASALDLILKSQPLQVYQDSGAQVVINPVALFAHPGQVSESARNVFTENSIPAGGDFGGILKSGRIETLSSNFGFHVRFSK